MGIYSHYSTGDAELEEAQTKIPSFTAPDLMGWRKVSNFGNIPKPSEDEGVQCGEVQIPVDGAEILAYTYWPANTSGGETFPLLINYHGGGFALGHPAMDHHICSALVTSQRISVLNVDYRLAPEHPFPTPVDDCYSALKWAVSHASELKADLDKGLVLCGTSAGGNLTAVVALLARDDQYLKYKPTGQILIIPEVYSKSLHPLDKYKDELQSMDELSESEPVLKPEFIKMLLDAYESKASEADIRSFKRSPLLADSLANLPPAVILVCGSDPLRDEGILYSKLLSQAIGENRVKLHIYPAAVHGFHYRVLTTTAAKKLAKDLEDGVTWLVKASF